MEPVEDFLQGWSVPGFSARKAFDGKSFDEIFFLEGIPLFWFWKRYLLSHVLPKPLNAYAELRGRKRLTVLRRVLLQGSSFALRNYVLFNELRKMKILPRKEEYTATRKALFLTYPDHLGSDNRFYRIQGIINTLSEDAVLEPFPLLVTPLSLARKSGQEEPKAALVYQYYDQEIKVKAKLQAGQIARRWRQIDSSSLDRALALDGFPLWPYVRPAFSFLMSPEFLQVVLIYYETFKKIIEKEKVAITFISGQNGLFERCVAAASQTKRIPCMLVPHGYAIGSLPPGDILDTMHLPLFNQKTAEFFIKSGVQESQLRVTGPAMYDNILSYKKRKKERNQRKEKKPSFPKNILLLTQPLVEDNLMPEKAYFTMVRKILEEIFIVPGITVTIKLHPRERRMNRYQEIAQSLSGNDLISVQQKGESDLLYRLLAEAEVVVNFFATAGVLEASILDIPSITFPFDQQKSNKYGDFDPSVYVFDLKALKPAIERLLENPSLQRQERLMMVREFCTKVDGKASERVARWAYELAERFSSSSTSISSPL